MARGLIPNIKKHKSAMFFKNLSFKDFLLIIGFLVIAGIVYMTTGAAQEWLRITLTLITFLIFAIFLIPQRNNKKLYNTAWNILKFLFSPKKWKYQDRKNNSVGFIKYQGIDKNGILETNFDNKKKFIAFLNIKGFDIYNLSETETEGVFRQLQKAFFNLETKFQIIKTVEEINLEENINFTKELLSKAKNKQTKKLLEIRLERFINNENDLRTEDVFYLSIEGNTREEVITTSQKLMTQLNDINLTTKIVPTKKVYELLFYIQGAIIDASDIKEKSITDLNLKLGYENMEVYKEFVKVNDECLINYSILEGYNSFPSYSWMFNITKSSNIVIFSINNKERGIVERGINNAITNIKMNANGIKEKDQVALARAEEEIEVYDEVLSAVTNKQDKFITLNTRLINICPDRKAIVERLREIERIAKDEEFLINRLPFRQLEGFKTSLIGSTDTLVKEFAADTTTWTIAEGFPFLSSGINDKRGYLLGTNTMGDLLIPDQFKNTLGKDPTALNANAFILGMAGSGKSTLTAGLILDHLALGRNVYIIDPEREYKKIAKYNEGVWIDVGSGTSGKFNPLEIISKFREKENDDEISTVDITTEILINQQVIFLEKFFKILNPELTMKETRYLLVTLKNFYIEWIGEKKIKEMKAIHYPIMSDYINFLKNIQSTTKWFKREINDELIDWIENDFVDGRYSLLYNQHSNIDFKGNKLVVFDVLALFDLDEKKLIEAQFLLMTAFIQNEMLTNGFYQENESLVFIDEAHLLVNENNPLLLDFVQRLVKRVRKRNGGVILATQNPKDFASEKADVAKKTEAILNNTQYSIIMKLSSDDLKAVNKIYERNGGLTQAQEEQLTFAQKGEGVLFIGTTDRQSFKQDFKPIVQELMNKGTAIIDETKF
ncbi:Mbov_0397 family ICE element conjugal transfer ATPase [Williamsoniiplasma luminosum]|uniref:TraG P-loop domain-containing protein n=1 Tax=Williamsoniiplasma luminosum TaxID=214888 RepID=A0A2S0NKG3_9MOLU|nr:helicase HerA-like domain-containing protein [Williamsoniiplasma luminosum]AVP49492.1 MAG: hypothetical protein C5T88_02855 [Williamsoniiplasma luminosum]